MASQGKRVSLPRGSKAQPIRNSTGGKAAYPKLAQPHRRPPTPPTPPIDPGETDPALVTRPSGDLEKSLVKTWALLPHRQMCIRFDVINPLMQFKRGSNRSDDPNVPFPRYNPSPEEDPDVTEEDDEDNPLELYEPFFLEQRTYVWRVRFSAGRFLSWTAGELAKVEFGMKKKKPNKQKWVLQYVQKWIPVPYARLIHQFILEVKHGKGDESHEALRRTAYAERMLEAFGRELEGYKGKKENFRSKVLNPVLQRQLRGIPDNYAGPLRDIMAVGGEVTIHNASAFYLRADPLKPRCIPSYRRNLIYIREARWHLMILEGLISVGSNDDFDWTIKNHHNILNGLEHGLSDDEEEDSKAEEDTNPIPKLRRVEVEVILVEKLNGHFADELDRVPGLVRKAADAEHGSPPPPRLPGPAKSHKRQRSGGEPSGKSTKRQKTKTSKKDVEDEAQIGDGEIEEAQATHDKDDHSGTRSDGPDEATEEEQTTQDKGGSTGNGGDQPDEEMEGDPTVQDKGCGSGTGDDQPGEGERVAHGSGTGGNQPDEEN